MRKLLILFPVFLLCFSSCKVFRPNLMLKTKRDFVYDKLNDSLSKQDYKLSPNDQLQFRVTTNDGYKLVDLANQTNLQYRTDYDVLVESDGQIKLPMVGYVKVTKHSSDDEPSTAGRFSAKGQHLRCQLGQFSGAESL